MSQYSPVAWTEGMFLRPQHFQQQERFLLNQNFALTTLLKQYAWGVYSIDIDDPLLKLGQFSLERFEGLFDDATHINMPIQTPLPEALPIPAGTKDQLIYLALPVSKHSAINISTKDSSNITRYHYKDQDVVDTSIGSEVQEQLQVAQLKCLLKLESEDLTGYTLTPIARVIAVSEDGVILLDRKYIPPNINIHCNPPLLAMIREIKGMIQQRAQAIAARLTQGQGTASSIADFLMLQILNRNEPLFGHYEQATGLHPHELYKAVISLSGELATFCSADKRCSEMPAYQHKNLTSVFSNLMVLVNQSLSAVLEQTATALPLEKTKVGIIIAPLNDKSLLENSQFVLAVKADVPNEELRQRFPAQIKIGTVESIRELVNNQLPGIALSSMPVAPRQVPYHAGYHYFQMDNHSELWRKLANSGGMALHLSGRYPGLQLELWAIKG